MATIPKKKKAQWRDLKAKRITLDLIELGHIRPSEKVAGRFLAEACIRAEERTRPVPSQKKAYKGVKFSFDSYLEMAIYIITELPHEWECCKELKKVWQQAKGKKAKNGVKPSIDRIYTEGFRKHYERDNIRVESNEDNRALATEDRKKPYKYWNVSGNGVEILRFESEAKAKEELGKNFKYAFPDDGQIMLKRNKRFKARYVEHSTLEETDAKILKDKAKYLEENGLTDLVKE